LQRTLFDSLRLELSSGSAGHTPGPAAQWARLSFPVGIGDQAPFVEAGIDAARLSGSGELPPQHPQPQPDPDRIGAIGRATLRTVFAYDAPGASGERPSSYIAIAQDVLPRWSIALLVFTLLLPVLAASVDSFARVRRRREPVTPWFRWIVAGALPFLVALLVGYFLALVGEIPDSSSVPVAPQVHRLHGAGWVSLALCTLFFVAALVLLRPRIAGRVGRRDSPGAAAALALTISVVSLAIWVVNPYTALLLLPAFHLWLLVTASPVAPSRPVGLALVIGAIVPALLILVALLARLAIGPLAGAWYGLLLLTGHQIGIYTAVVASLLVSCFACAIRIAVAREPAR
jgi:hypothetical protein